MQFSNNFNFKPANIFKIAGLALIVIIVITFAFRLIGLSLNKLNVSNQSAPAFGIDEMYSGSGEKAYAESESAIALSTRNLSPTSISPINNNITTGDDAEEFEVTEYRAKIETRQLENTCNEIVALKVRDDVIFESANEYERSCNYNFKVKRSSVPEILTIIEALNPKELSESTYTIKRLIDDYTSEVEILEKKMSSIEEILVSAVNAYNDITELATKTRDVENLAKIIDSKISIIERLAQEKIKINSQLERLGRAKAEQLDRLDYTYFYIRILEDKFIDGQRLKDSWKSAIKSFVLEINGIIQDVTVNLVALLFSALQYLIYFFIILIIIKYGWRLTKYIWKK